ncbi:MAG: pyrroline-5-carboxylate reductase [Eubacteriales bacterium]|nr:pyrroline-5-carboxylate reductase [Eubacteriales bacterium]
MMVIGFIGLGNMAQAIIAGMRHSGEFKDRAILGCDHNEDKRRDMADRLGVINLPDDLAVAAQADMLVLAIKPQALPAVLERIMPRRKVSQCTLSLAAGRPIAWLEKALGNGSPIIRAMPNVAARVGGSVTALCKNERVTTEQQGLATGIFEAVGHAMWMAEARMSAFSAITGAAPAFTFLYLDALASAGLKAGLPKAVALEAACHMVVGVSKLVLETGGHPAAIIDQVTSPGGTTIEGMHALKALGFEHAVYEAVKAVMEKERSLAENS